jgi:hypothetical protein
MSTIEKRWFRVATLAALAALGFCLVVWRLGASEEKGVPPLAGTAESAASLPSVPRRSKTPSKARPEVVHSASSAVMDEAAVLELARQDATEDADPRRESERLRAPVIAAIRTPELDPLERRVRILAAMAESGPSDEPWTRDRRAIFEGWDRALGSAGERNVDYESAECFRAGCVVTVTFPDDKAFEASFAAFRTLSETGQAHGGRVQTPPEVQADGRVQSSWIFLRPEAGAQ